MIRSFSEYDYQIYYIVNAFRFLSIAAIRKKCYEKELRAFEAAAEKKKKKKKKDAGDTWPRE